MAFAEFAIGQAPQQTLAKVPDTHQPIEKQAASDQV